MKTNIKYVVLPVLGILISLVYFSLGCTTDISSLGGDSAGYLLAAQYFSPYHPASAVVLDYSKQIIYPPLFPVLLALLGGGKSILIAHEIVICFLLISMVFLYRWARSESLSVWMSAVLVLLFALMPATYLMSFNVWTENLYLLFSLMAIASLSRDPIPSERMWMLVAVAVSAAMLTRVAALPLAFAFLLYLAIHRPKQTVLLASVAMVPFAVWAVVSAVTERGAGAYISHLQGKYLDNPLHFFVIQLMNESQALYHAWIDAWLGPAPTLIALVIVNLFGVLGLVGWLVRLKALRFDALYMASYLVMLMIWPHPEEALRYSYVLFPLLLIAAFQMLMRAPVYRSDKSSYHLASIGMLALLLIAMLPTMLLNIGYYYQRVPNSYAESKHRAEWYVADRQQAYWNAIYMTSLLNHLATLSEWVKDGECIFAIKPTIVSLYSNRRSYGPPTSAKDDKEFSKEMGKCQYIYVLPFSSPSYHDELYPLRRLGSRAHLVSEKRMRNNALSPLIGALYKISE